MSTERPKARHREDSYEHQGCDGYQRELKDDVERQTHRSEAAEAELAKVKGQLARAAMQADFYASGASSVNDGKEVARRLLQYLTAAPGKEKVDADG